jgi:hypothetical protein
VRVPELAVSLSLGTVNIPPPIPPPLDVQVTIWEQLGGTTLASSCVDPPAITLPPPEIIT